MLKIQIALNRLPSTESPWQKIRNMEIPFGKTSRQVICTRIISNIYTAYRYSYIFNYIYIYCIPMIIPCFFLVFFFPFKNTSYPSWDEIPSNRVQFMRFDLLCMMAGLLGLAILLFCHLCLEETLVKKAEPEAMAALPGGMLLEVFANRNRWLYNLPGLVKVYIAIDKGP